MEVSLEYAIIDFADKYLGEYRIKRDELIPTYCPYCDGGKYRDKETFAINLDTGTWNCMRGKCGKTGTFRALCNDFAQGEYKINRMEKKTMSKVEYYDLPEVDILDRTDEVNKYFASRRISEETLDAFGIGCDEHGNIVFPFYRNNVLTYVKYRKPCKHDKASRTPKEWQISNTEPILFGMDNVSFQKKLYITEGQIDALSLYEAGITNVVSVPCGCDNMEWIETCKDWLENFSEIVIFGDNDEPGIRMQRSVMKRLGDDVCMLPPEYPELIYDGNDYGRLCKDANEILIAYGEEELYNIAERCEPAPIRGLIKLSSVKYVDPSLKPVLSTGVQDLDLSIGGFGYGDLVVVSGGRGSGKSTITGKFLLNAVDEGISVCAYSAELSASSFLNSIVLQATERKYVEYRRSKLTGKNYPVVSDEIQERIQNWLGDKFILYDNQDWDDDDFSTPVEDKMLRLFKAAVKRYHAKVFLVDNLMTLASGREDELAAQTKITLMLKKFAVKYGVIVLLVAHPRKTKPGMAMTNDDVAGSANITNLADTVLNIERPNIRVMKNRLDGDLNLIYCDYDPTNKRIFQSNMGDTKVYGWDHTGIKEPKYQAMNLKEFAIIHNNDQPI